MRELQAQDREPSELAVLESLDDPVASPLESAHQRLRLSVIGDAYGEVDVLRHARLDVQAVSKVPSEGAATIKRAHVRVRLMERREHVRH